MDSSFLLIVAVVALGVWLFVARPRRKRERQQDNERWAELTKRVYQLESSLQELRNGIAVRKTPSSTRPVRADDVAFTANSTAPSSVGKSSEGGTTEVAPLELGEAEVPRPILPATMREAGADAFGAPPQWVIPESPAPMFAVQPGPTLFEKLKGSLDLEETLGANWLNKIGIVILVIGVALFLAYQLRQVGPAGKVLVGALVSAALLLGGVFMERKPGYRVLGRAGIGGGWALAFFTAYAMYHVEATRVFTSQAPDLLLMLVVAAAMVVHTLRYRSQVVTGLAFLLAFSTLTISQVTVYSLTAGAILALGLVVVVWRMQWFELEIFGIAAAYGNHWWWLHRIIGPMGSHKRPFPEFLTSTAILLFYWAIFRVSYIVRECDEREEKVSTIAALLNSVALLGLMKYQSVHPEWAFWALLVMGAVELGLSLLPITRRRRAAFLILATIGVTLLVAAMPFHFTGARLDALWLLEAEGLLLAGIFVREVLFRRLGILASMLVPIYLLSGDAGTLFGLRYYGLPATRDVKLAVLCLVASLVFFANSHIVVRRWPELFEHVIDRTAMHRFSFVGAFLLLVAAWAAFPQSLTAFSWSVLGLILLVIGSRLRLEQLPLEAHFHFACAFVATLSTNLPASAAWGHVSQRLVTVSLVAATFYAASRWSSAATEAWPRISKALPLAYRWMASLLLILLAYYALRPVSVSPAWLVLALVLIEAGTILNLTDVRAQGYVTLALAFVAIFFVNLNAGSLTEGLSPRLYTVSPLVLALYYIYDWLTRMPEQPPLERRFHVSTTAAWCGAIALAALLRFELNLDWVAAAWAVCALVLLIIAWRSGRELFLHQALFFAIGATFRGALHNLYERSYLPGPFWHSRALCTGVTAVLLFTGLWFAFRLRKREEAVQSADSKLGILRALVRRPEQLFFFLPLGLIVALLAVEMRRGLITVSWSALGVLVFLFALWVGERSFRLAGLALLLLGVGKIIVVDVWELNPRDRYLTFISMGSALLLVSFLYSRYREAIRRYL
jgi:uncharacterized membrane protein